MGEQFIPIPKPLDDDEEVDPALRILMREIDRDGEGEREREKERVIEKERVRERVREKERDRNRHNMWFKRSLLLTHSPAIIRGRDAQRGNARR